MPNEQEMHPAKLSKSQPQLSSLTSSEHQTVSSLSFYVLLWLSNDEWWKICKGLLFFFPGSTHGSVNFELCCISSIHHVLSDTDDNNSCLCLDYFLPFGGPQYLLSKQQKVQTNAACLPLRVPKTDNIFCCFSQLAAHWFMNTVQIHFSVLQLPQWQCDCS